MDEDQWLLTALEDEHGLLQAFGDVEWVVAAQVEPVRGRRPEGQAVGGCRGRQPKLSTSLACSVIVSMMGSDAAAVWGLREARERTWPTAAQWRGSSACHDDQAGARRVGR